MKTQNMQERDERQVDSGPSQSILRPLAIEEGPIDWDTDRKATK